MANPKALLALAAALAIAGPAAAAKAAKPAKKGNVALKIEFDLSHYLPAAQENELKKLIERFNERNQATPIKLVRLGEGGKPALLNILRRPEAAEFAADKKGFKPLFAVMKEAGEKFDPALLSRDLKAGVADERGRLYALPVAYSTPVLFYNKNAFRKAKLDPEKPPTTWQEVQEVSGALSAAGYQCPYTTSWPAWVHIDNLTALSGSSLTTPKGELAFNGLAQVRHIAKLATWKTAGYFHLFGRKNEADEQFKNGNCVMLTTDGSAHTDFREAQGVELGIAPLPHPDEAWGGRHHSLAQGSSLWISAGRSAAEYKVAAKFVSFLLSPEGQVQLAGVYGHLPLTEAARLAMKSEALRDRLQVLEVAFASLKGRGAQAPVRVSDIEPVRQIVDEELERVWNEGTPPKLALDTAVARGNVLLKAKPALKKPLPF